MIKFKLYPLIALSFVSVGTLGRTADNELYDAPPPDDAAFIRWIDTDPAPEVLGVRSLGLDGDAFHPVSVALTDGASVGAFYTAAVNALGHLVVVEEPPRADKSKVLVTLLNLTNNPVRLVLTDQKVDVIGATAANAAGGRSVNPVSAKLSVLSVSDAVLGVFDVQLRRGQNITFVARPEGAELIENRFGPNIEG
ncbi:alginate O-acetyltransferase AlgF [Shimia isoporae]|uniref:Alginate biosynthesis protein AlgF n=1 Tax=Shimia isoporae TaxID=647720 RepID=A0A4R1NU86_9RHOB|nr:alginate O-acetyltransferase AlgF [Shimia isoporae]TCL08828.1 alginate O-acetyltransferase AlgF [Shimia isoporae]